MESSNSPQSLHKPEINMLNSAPPAEKIEYATETDIKKIVSLPNLKCYHKRLSCFNTVSLNNLFVWSTVVSLTVFSL